MQSGATFLVRGSNYCRNLLFLSAVVLLTLGASMPAQALGTSVQAVVDQGDIHPALTLTSPVPPVTVTEMPLELSGTLESLTQIRVYVDDVFSVTIPLNESATTFSSTLAISSGTHVVKLIGISPFSDISPTVSIVVTYTPPQSSQEGQGASSGSGSTSSDSNEKRGGIVIGPNGSTAASTTYVAPANATALPGWLYNGLLALDIARPGDTDGKELTKTVQRISLASSGLFFFAFARPTLMIYRRVRYTWLGFSKRALPQPLRHHPLLSIRIIGALLISGVFWFV